MIAGCTGGDAVARINAGNLGLDIEHIKTLFKDHVPKYQKLEGEAEGNGRLSVEYLEIRKPDGGFYWAHYLCVGGRLFVTGDMYAAIYQWGAGIDMKWIANCDLDYFQSKVVAVPTNCGVDNQFRAWDEEVAKAQLENMLFRFESPLSLTDALGCTGGALGSRYDWGRWLDANNYEGGDTRLLFPDYDELDSDFHSDVHSLGWDVSVICAQHLYGLKDAMRKLGGKEEEEK